MQRTALQAGRLARNEAWPRRKTPECQKMSGMEADPVATLPGIDVLIQRDFAPLRGKRIGLVTNHTGLTADGQATVDVLHHAPEVELKALFGPEHGIRGMLDEKIADGRDERTGLPVYSLYGETMRPKPDQLAGLDALVFDIQDIGCRFYTYISTLGNCLEEASRAEIQVVVLDRPNPIRGDRVEGPLSDSGEHTFTAWHPVPIRHGLTVGELGRLFNVERKIGAELEVVPCEGWRRSKWWDETGLTWTNPSPNMRSLTQALLYPGVGLLETTNLSVGRGTDTPFEVIGAPWLDGRSWAKALNSAGLKGVRFVPVRFVPKASVFQGVMCGGINLVVTDRVVFSPILTGFMLATTLRDEFGSAWNGGERYNRLLANRSFFDRLNSGASPEKLARDAAAEASRFAARCGKYRIYR